MQHTENDALQLIAEAVKEIVGPARADLKALDLDRDLREIGLDSVAALEVAGLLEQRLKRQFADHRLARIRSLRDFLVLVREE